MEWRELLSPVRVRDLDRETPTTPPDPSEDRTEFERDYDRAVFSTPVRRLQDKTQVFPLEPLDFVRTRLTHSIEVSTLARGLARRISKWLRARDEIDEEQADAIQTISATCGLIHDLGNPPFGHAGEQAIGEWFASRFENRAARLLAEEAKSAEAQRTELPSKMAFSYKVSALDGRLRADFSRFEGNAQTLRLVSRLQVLKDDTGLNLTAGTLSALMKYTAPSYLADAKAARFDHHKPGYFASEKDLVEHIRRHTGTGDARNPIAYIVEACDDIAYSVLDFEDGIKKGLARWSDAKERLLNKAGGDAACEGKVRSLISEAEKYIDDASPLLKARARDEGVVSFFRTMFIRQAISDVAMAFQESYASIKAGTFKEDLVGRSASRGVVSALKAVDRDLFYRAHETVCLELMGRKILTDLLDMFAEGVAWEGKEAPSQRDFAGKYFHLMSSNYRNVFDRSLESSILPPEYCRIQLVVDYVCGMTDTFARNLHRQLCSGNI